jgi:hypothetical protein
LGSFLWFRLTELKTGSTTCFPSALAHRLKVVVWRGRTCGRWGKRAGDHKDVCIGTRATPHSPVDARVQRD